MKSPRKEKAKYLSECSAELIETSRHECVISQWYNYDLITVI